MRLHRRMKFVVFGWFTVLSLLLTQCSGGAPAAAPSGGGGASGGAAASNNAGGAAVDEAKLMEAAKKWVDSEFQPSTLSKADQMKEMEWFIKAAEQGNISALNHLGDMYWDGIGVTKDIIKVTELYKKAEEQLLSYGGD